MTATDPVQAVAEALAEHNACGHCEGECGACRSDAEVAVAAARPLIAAEALRDAAEAVPPGPHPNGCLAVSCGECARRYERDRLREWLSDRADRIERGESR